MKIATLMVLLQTSCLCATLCSKQFVNLKFDEADVNRVIPLPGDSNYFSGDPNDLLPGWTYIFDKSPATVCYYALRPETSYGLTVIPESRFDSGSDSGGKASYMLGVSADKPWDHITPTTGIIPAGVSISQRGEVPLGAREFRFDFALSSDFGIRDTVELRINGQYQLFMRVGSGRGVEQYAIDVSSFAGKEVDLEIKFTPGVFGFFDISGFTQIPEPSTWALLLTGVGSVVWYSRRERRATLNR